MKLYTDASCGDDCFGVGFVLKLRNGARITGKYYSNTDVSSMESEWYGMMEGIIVAINNRTAFDSEISIITDCKPLAQKMKHQEESQDYQWAEYRERTTGKLTFFDEWSILWEARSSSMENEKADRMAREALWEAREDDSVKHETAIEGLDVQIT